MRSRSRPQRCSEREIQRLDHIVWKSRLSRLFAISMMLFPYFGLFAQEAASSKPVIVSPTHPVDSIGETVYSYGDKDGMDAVVPGVLLPPKVLVAPKPKFSKALKKRRLTCDVAVTGTVSATGIMLDLESNQDADPDAAASALEAVRAYRMTPPTLNGKPVAMAIRIIVHFHIY